jgi:NADP-dependent 3-hydroxy acid dehydrogenase YdfG
MDFKNKVILVSGATGGIGQEAVRQLSSHNCKLSIFGRKQAVLEEICKNPIEKGSECIYHICDVTDKEQVERGVKSTYEHYGRIDLAIHTAGIISPNPIETFNSEIIIKHFVVNFFGALYFIEFILPIMMKQRSGTIAAVSTLPDKRGAPGWGAYGASKAALSNILESLRAEAKLKFDIDVITIKPGAVETRMTEGYKRPGKVTVEHAVKLILRGIQKGRKVIEFPFVQVFPTKVRDMLPYWAYDMFPMDFLQGDDYPNGFKNKE